MLPEPGRAGPGRAAQLAENGVGSVDNSAVEGIIHQKKKIYLRGAFTNFTHEVQLKRLEEIKLTAAAWRSFQR